jgi:hypothetical protein
MVPLYSDAYTAYRIFSKGHWLNTPCGFSASSVSIKKPVFLQRRTCSLISAEAAILKNPEANQQLGLEISYEDDSLDFTKQKRGSIRSISYFGLNAPLPTEQPKEG